MLNNPPTPPRGAKMIINMSSNKNIVLVAKKLGLHEWQVENTIRLMDDGATIPFHKQVQERNDRQSG